MTNGFVGICWHRPYLQQQEGLQCHCIVYVSPFPPDHSFAAFCRKMLIRSFSIFFFFFYVFTCFFCLLKLLYFYLILNNKLKITAVWYWLNILYHLPACPQRLVSVDPSVSASAPVHTNPIVSYFYKEEIQLQNWFEHSCDSCNCSLLYKSMFVMCTSNVSWAEHQCVYFNLVQMSRTKTPEQPNRPSVLRHRVTGPLTAVTCVDTLAVGVSEVCWLQEWEWSDTFLCAIVRLLVWAWLLTDFWLHVQQDVCALCHVSWSVHE